MESRTSRWNLSSTISRASQFMRYSVLLCVWLMGISASASAHTTSSVETSRAALFHSEVLSYAQEHGLPFGLAAERLEWQRLAPILQQRARAQLGPAFGGVWIDNEDHGRVKLGLAQDKPRLINQARRISVSSGLGGAVDIVPVDRSERELNAIASELRGELARATGAGLISATLETLIDKNAIRITLPSSAVSPAQQKIADDAKEKYGSALESSSNGGQFHSDACTYPVCEPPLRAGVEIFSYAGGGSCTAGFLARAKTKSTLYQLTAGHCMKNEALWSTKYTNPGYYEVIGPRVANYVGSAGDVGMYEIENESLWLPRPWVFWYETSEGYPIYSDADPVVGQTVCKDGAFYSGKSDCGEVKSVSSEVKNEEGIKMILVRTSYCSKAGDSGAPVHYYGVAYGLHMGHIEKLPWLPCDSYFTRVHVAEEKLGVDVRHEASCDPLSSSRVKIGDMNGDAKADIYRFPDPPDEIGAGFVWKSEGKSYKYLGQVNTGFGVAYQDRLADWDGDGDDDILQFSEYGRVDGWRSDGTSYAQLSQVGYKFATSCETRIGDMNGDSKDDIFRFTDDGYGYVWLATGNPKEYAYKGQIGTGFGHSNEVRPVDIDGDGDDDLIQFTNEGNGYAWFSNGTSYTNKGLIGTGFGSASQVRVGDRDGDGDEDLFQFTDEGKGYYWRSNGATYTYLGIFTSGFGPSRQVRIADINGDKRSDILSFSDEGVGQGWLGTEKEGFESLGQIGTGFGKP